MALRKILTDSDPALHKVCRPVTNFDQRLWDLLDDLKETLADAGGAGLAAPQVGILRRCVIVVDAQDELKSPCRRIPDGTCSRAYRCWRSYPLPKARSER